MHETQDIGKEMGKRDQKICAKVTANENMRPEKKKFGTRE